MDVAGIVSGAGQALGAIGQAFTADKVKREQQIADAKNGDLRDMLIQREIMKKTVAGLGKEFGDNSLSNITVPKTSFTYDEVKPKPMVDPNALGQAVANMGGMLAQAGIGNIPKKDKEVTPTQQGAVQTDPNAAKTSGDQATNKEMTGEAIVKAEEKGGKLKPKFNPRSFKKNKK